MAVYRVCWWLKKFFMDLMCDTKLLWQCVYSRCSRDWGIDPNQPDPSNPAVALSDAKKVFSLLHCVCCSVELGLGIVAAAAVHPVEREPPGGHCICCRALHFGRRSHSDDFSGRLAHFVWGEKMAARAVLARCAYGGCNRSFYTVFSEWNNTVITRTWAYSQWMPTLWGIGLSPILRWLLIPAWTFWWLSKQAFEKQV